MNKVFLLPVRRPFIADSGKQGKHTTEGAGGSVCVYAKPIRMRCKRKAAEAASPIWKIFLLGCCLLGSRLLLFFFRGEVELGGYHDYAAALGSGFGICPFFRLEVALHRNQVPLLQYIEGIEGFVLRQASTPMKEET